MNPPLPLSLSLSLAAGLLLSAIFFGGLWWTVRKATQSAQPALWVFCSMWVRTCIALGGFYVVASGHWERLLMCVLGFAISRAFVTWLTEPNRDRNASTPLEAEHAP